MDRNLARQLKLAEFPIGAYRVGHKFYPNEDDLGWSEQARRHGISINIYDLENRLQTLRNGYYCPNLSDLIDACGRDFGSLYPIKDIWNAESSDGKQVAVGHAPDEAVARLWFALNNLRPSQKASAINHGDETVAIAACRFAVVRHFAFRQQLQRQLLELEPGWQRHTFAKRERLAGAERRQERQEVGRCIGHRRAQAQLPIARQQTHSEPLPQSCLT